MIYRAGFELGTGLSVNITDPEDVAKELRGGEELSVENRKPEVTTADQSSAQQNQEPVKTKEEKIEDLKAKLAALGIE